VSYSDFILCNGVKLLYACEIQLNHIDMLAAKKEVHDEKVREDRGLLSRVAKDYLELRGVDGVDLTDATEMRQLAIDVLQRDKGAAVMQLALQQPDASAVFCAAASQISMALTIRMKDGLGSKISCVAVSWPRIAAGAQSGELYHLEVIMVEQRMGAPCALRCPCAIDLHVWNEECYMAEG
jgi:hypothetical protein